MRARWLKPEAFHDRRLAKIGLGGFVVYQALRCIADDSGVAQADADLLHGQMFFRWPTVGLQELYNSLLELHNAKVIVLYMVGDDTYAEIPDWNEKEIANPSKFRHPKMAEGVVLKRLTDNSDKKATVAVQEESCSPHILESYNPRILDTHTSVVASDDASVSRVDREFEEAWMIYPKRSGGNSRHDSLKAYRARRRSGVERTTVFEGTTRYAAYCEAKGWIGTEYVMQGVRFFGPSEQYAQPWDLPKHGPNDQNRRLAPGERTKANIDAMLGKVSA